MPLLLWLPIVIYHAGRVNEYFPAFGIRRTLSVYSVFFASGSVWQGQGPGYPARLVLLAAVLAGAALLARRAEGRLCAFLAVVPWVVTALIWLAGLRIFDVRNLLVVAPFAAMCLAALVAAIPLRPLAYAAGAVLAGLALWAYSIDRDLARTPGVSARRARPLPADAAALVAPARPPLRPRLAAGAWSVSARVRRRG